MGPRDRDLSDPIQTSHHHRCTSTRSGTPGKSLYRNGRKSAGHVTAPDRLGLRNHIGPVARPPFCVRRTLFNKSSLGPLNKVDRAGTAKERSSSTRGQIPQIQVVSLVDNAPPNRVFAHLHNDIDAGDVCAAFDESSDWMSHPTSRVRRSTRSCARAMYVVVIL